MQPVVLKVCLSRSSLVKPDVKAKHRCVDICFSICNQVPSVSGRKTEENEGHGMKSSPQLLSIKATALCNLKKSSESL